MIFDVTDILLRYRDALRQTYNNFVRTLYVDPSFGDSWDKIEEALLEAMVYEQLFGEFPSKGAPIYSLKWRDQIRLKLDTGHHGAKLLYALREGNERRFKELTVQEQNFDMHFVDFFDWTKERGMNNEYVEAKILTSNHEILTDEHEILVEVEPVNVSFYMNEEPFYRRELGQ